MEQGHPMITPEQIAQALEYRKASPRWSWDRIACHMGISDYHLRCAIDPAHKARVLAVAQAAKQRDKDRRQKIKNDPRSMPDPKPGYSAAIFGHVGGHLLDIPREVLIDREIRKAMAPRDLTAMLCGDPPSGYSALDQTLGRRPLYERLKG